MDPSKPTAPPGAVETMAAVSIVAVPICYICSKKASSLVLYALVACLWIVFLSIPCIRDMPLHFFPTMMASVLSFIVPLKLVQLILFPPSRDDTAVSKKNDGDKPIDTNSLCWKEFGSFVGSFLYYLIPLSFAKKPLPTWPVLLKRNGSNLLIVLCKIAIVPLFEIALNQLAREYPYLSLTGNPVVYTKVEVLFTMELIAMAWSTDIQSVIINLVTGGHVEMLYMHNYPFLSSSLRDLWGYRYNRLINILLKETVYIPAQTYFGCSKQVASFLAFLTSGILHSWVAYFTFGGGVLRASLFFVLQALWIGLVEGSEWYRRNVPVPIKAVLTICYFYVTAWLYVGLFVEALSDWLEKNPQTVPNLPLVRDVTNLLATSLGLVRG